MNIVYMFADPLQKRNLASDPACASVLVLAELKKKMSSEMARIGDRFHPVTYYRENWVRGRIIQRTQAD